MHTKLTAPVDRDVLGAALDVGLPDYEDAVLRQAYAEAG